MKDLNLKEKSEFFKETGPAIARQMTKVLQGLTAEKIQVEFDSIRTYEHSKVSVDVGEKCFGSYVKFKSPEDNPEGIVVAVFPLSGTKMLSELLLKQYLKKHEEEATDYRIKLSAFKEAVNILLLTYITGVANALDVRVKTGIPRFVCFRNLEFLKPALLKRYTRSMSLISVEQFRITAETMHYPSSVSLKGRFIILF